MRDCLEVGVHGRGRLVAIRGLLRERSHDEQVEVLGDLRPLHRWGLGDLGEMLHGDLDRRLARERHVSGEELVEDDPGGVEIRGLVDRRAARLLGREVLRGADDRALLRHLARAGARDAEVRDLDHALRVDDDVVRLDVAVDDPVAVRVAERSEDLARVRDGDRHRARATLADQLLERAPLDVLHDDEVRAVRLPAVVDRDDVRMGEPGGVRRLAAEALDELVVVRVALVQDLHRDPPAELLVLREVDVGHPSAAELPGDPVARGEERSVERVLGRHDVPRG